MAEQIQRWIVSDRVLTPEGTEAAWGIGIRDGIIERIVPAEHLRGAARALLYGDAVPVEDYGRRPVAPAWCNSHCHLAMAPLRGVATLAARKGNVVTDVFFSLESHLEERDVYVFTKLGAYESMLCGVAAVWDHYYYGMAVADALEEVGMSAVVAPTLQDIEGPGCRDWERALDETRRLAERGSTLVQAAIGLHASDTVSDELFERARQTSMSLGLPIHMHLAQSADEMRAAAARFERELVVEVAERLADCSVLVAHGCFLDDAQVRHAVGCGWILAHCPLSQVQFGVVGPVHAWQSAGGRWVVGTDCVASNDSLDVQRELPVVAAEPVLATSYGRRRRELARRGGLPEVEALEGERRQRLGEVDFSRPKLLLEASWGPRFAATSASGETSRHGRSAGGVEVGCPANLQVFDPDHPSLFPGTDLARSLAYGSTAGALHQLIIAGRDMGAPGRFHESILTMPEYGQTLAEARARARELFARAGLDRG